jgi:YD repeat-containing protein
MQSVMGDRMLRSASAGAVLLLSGTVSASERVDICAVYSNTGSTYHVTAIAIAGSELNQATHSFNYNSLGHYIVIFWAQDQATVIEMSGFPGRPSFFQQSGTEGRSWEISAYSPMNCAFQ